MCWCVRGTLADSHLDGAFVYDYVKAKRVMCLSLCVCTEIENRLRRGLELCNCVRSPSACRSQNRNMGEAKRREQRQRSKRGVRSSENSRTENSPINPPPLSPFPVLLVPGPLLLLSMYPHYSSPPASLWSAATGFRRPADRRRWVFGCVLSPRIRSPILAAIMAHFVLLASLLCLSSAAGNT